MRLPLEYYLNPDVVEVSRDLLGKFLFTKIDEVITGGMIIETEAYCAPEDRASHAYKNRKTQRNAAMFRQGGVCYVYKCYGIHDLFNVVTNEQGIPHAVLIRAIQPLVGIEKMLERRKKEKVDRLLTGGPGTLTQALGITVKKHNGLSLIGSVIWLEDTGIKVPPEKIIAGPRVGVDYAEEDALLPWRFRFR